jgi:hypothetical protein
MTADTATIERLTKAHRELGRKVREAKRLAGISGYDEHRDDMAQRNLQASKEGREIKIPGPRDWPLRIALERSIYRWLGHYFPELFFNPFNSQQKRMVQATLHAARHGGDQSIAAPRGEGKTVITECVVSYCIVTGRLKFPLIVAATGPDAQGILGNIKRQFETNAELKDQYPEVCCPIWELEGAAQRANMQTCCQGHRTRLKWGQDRIVFADVPNFIDATGREVVCRCRGSVLMTRGLDSAIRGIRYGSLRPDLVLIDDPETRESVESDTQISKRIRTIEQDIGGLGGPGRRMGRLLLCTIMNRRGVAYRYTDPTQQPIMKTCGENMLNCDERVCLRQYRRVLWWIRRLMRRLNFTAFVASKWTLDQLSPTNIVSTHARRFPHFSIATTSSRTRAKMRFSRNIRTIRRKQLGHRKAEFIPIS